MLRCPSCQQRGLGLFGVIFMVHDERVVCHHCGTAFTIPKSRKSLIVGLEYLLLLASVVISIKLRSLWPSATLLIVLAVVRALLIPGMAVEKKRELNRLRKYRRK